MFFLSSPTPAPQYPPQTSPFFPSATKQSHPQHIWTTRETHENAHAQLYNKSTYAPHSPSPLRTARNANLMVSPTPSTGSKFLGASLLSSSPMRSGFEEDAENWCTDGDGLGVGHQAMPLGLGMRSKTHATPMGKVNGSMLEGYGLDEEVSSNLITPPDSGSQAHRDGGLSQVLSSPFAPSLPSGPASTSVSTAPPSQTVLPQSQQSQWSLRSRESSPSALLTSHTTRNREERKSRFLDRIRRRRDDERSEIVGDQVLRMDFVRERRGWEDGMARRAALEAGGDGGVEDGDDEEDLGVDEEMSPTEEYDYEYGYEHDELVRESADQVGADQAPLTQSQARHEEEFPLVDGDDVEDEEYERLFREMEILSQQSQPHSQPQSQNQAHERSQSPIQNRRESLQSGQVQQEPRQADHFDQLLVQHELSHQRVLDSGGDQMMDLS